MLRKLSQRRILIGTLAVFILLSLLFFLYWKTSNNAILVEKGNIKHRVTDEIKVSDSKQATRNLSTNPEKENAQTPDKGPDAKEIKEAIDFLDELQQETYREKTDTIPNGIASNRTPSQDEMIELVREGISYYDSLLESASVKFSLVMTSNDYPGIRRIPSGTWEGTFEFSGSQVRGVVTENATQYGSKFGETQRSGTHEFANNGETFELFRDTPNGKKLTRQNKIMHNPSHDPRFWGWNLSGEEPLLNLIDRLDIKDIQSVEWNGSQVYHIKGSFSGAGTDVDLWLNPEKSYRPERFVYSIHSEGTAQVRGTKDFNFQEVAPDLWFPTSAQSVTTFTNTETGESINLESATMTLTDVRVNEHIPSSRFSIDPPSGTTVFDMRSRETYTVGEDD